MSYILIHREIMKYIQSVTYKLVGESKKIIKNTPNAYFSFEFRVKFVSKKGIFWENGWFPLVPRKIWVTSLKIFKTDPIDNTWLRRNSGELIFLSQHTSEVNTSELPKFGPEAEKWPTKRPNSYLPENRSYPELPQDMGDLRSHWVGSVWPQKMGVIWV